MIHFKHFPLVFAINEHAAILWIYPDLYDPKLKLPSHINQPVFNSYTQKTLQLSLFSLPVITSVPMVTIEAERV